MNPGLQTAPGYVGSGALTEQRNRVLRNTYWLLALTSCPLCWVPGRRVHRHGAGMRPA